MEFLINTNNVAEFQSLVRQFIQNEQFDLSSLRIEPYRGVQGMSFVTINNQLLDILSKDQLKKLWVL